MIDGAADGSGGRSVAGRWSVLFAAVFTGEMIFTLPFHVPRYFRPTMLDVFGFSNARLGDVFALYGVLAMLSYFPGGVIADRFSDRKLMVVSLISTALGGVAMATIPSDGWVAVIYGYWGVSSVLLFWAALIRATRVWGGDSAQGRAFGLLDGGRGLIGAMAASAGVFALGALLPGVRENATPEEQRAGLQAVIWLYTSATLVGAGLVWFLIPEREIDSAVRGRNPLIGVGEALRRPTVWVMATLVVCAYCGYKGTDNVSLYAVQVLGLDEVRGAALSANSTYIRPIACIAAGLLSDRIGGARTMAFLFAGLVGIYALLGLGEPTGAWVTILYANIFASFVGVFALRGVYFALLEESSTPSRITGTAVGLVSVIGYTPDIFFAAVTGRLLDRTPGVGGHHDYYWFLVAVMTVGVFMSLLLMRLNRVGEETTETEFIPAASSHR